MGQVQLAVRAALSGLDRPAHLDGPVLVAVSGGADSLALLAATVHVAVPTGVAVHAVTVDHGWHRRSGEVAGAVARAALELGADGVRVVRVRPARRASGGWVGGPEEAARTARLAALVGAADRDAADAVLLGHTLDDQAEQVLLSLARGSGTRALAGMAGERPPFLRPLLGLRRDVVRAACPDLPGSGLPWEDPANTDGAYLRARVRTDLVPVLSDVLGAGAVTSLARSAALLRADDEALAGWAEREATALLASSSPSLTPSPSDEADAGGDPSHTPPVVEVPLPGLLALPVAVRTRVLRLLAARSGARALTERHTRALDLLVSGGGRGPVALPGSVAASRVTGPDRCGRLRLAVDRTPREDPHGRP